MAEKKEASVSPANERLQLWLSFAKFCIAVFFIFLTLVEMTKQDVRGKVKVAEIYSEGASSAQAPAKK